MFQPPFCDAISPGDDGRSLAQRVAETATSKGEDLYYYIKYVRKSQYSQ